MLDGGGGTLVDSGKTSAMLDGDVMRSAQICELSFQGDVTGGGQTGSEVLKEKTGKDVLTVVDPG